MPETTTQFENPAVIVTRLDTVQPQEYTTPDKLKQLLITRKIWNDDWREDSLQLLWHDLQSGQKKLVAGENITALTMTIISADVYYYDLCGNEYKLTEDWHALVSPDPGQTTGSVNRKTRVKPRALSEKINPDEPVPQALVRAIHEELGITQTGFTSTYLGSSWETSFSTRFPGLPNFTKINAYQVYLKSREDGGMPFRTHTEEEDAGSQVKVVHFSLLPQKSSRLL